MTLSKLAALANVSVSVVSKAFSGRADVSDSMREHVFAVAKENGCFEQFYHARYDKPVIAVDTHVFRVSRRLGLSDGANVEAVEKDLTAGFAEELRGKAHHWLILHGRYVCTARKPKCESCGLKDYCREYITNNVVL